MFIIKCCRTAWHCIIRIMEYAEKDLCYVPFNKARISHELVPTQIILE